MTFLHFWRDNMALIICLCNTDASLILCRDKLTPRKLVLRTSHLDMLRLSVLDGGESKRKPRLFTMCTLNMCQIALVCITVLPKGTYYLGECFTSTDLMLDLAQICCKTLILSSCQSENRTCATCMVNKEILA